MRFIFKIQMVELSLLDHVSC